MDATFKSEVRRVEKEIKRTKKSVEIKKQTENLYPGLVTLIREYVSAIHETVVDDEWGYLT
jgi:CRISPR/Cas system-associated protein Csm6